LKQLNSIEQELDGRHAEANLAFARKDIGTYREIFSPSLAYRQPDGRVIGRDELMRDVAVQFRRLDRAAWGFIREDLRISSGQVRETLIQKATAETTVFGFVHRRWKMNRRGIYTWTAQEGRWVIKQVEVLSETVTSAGWSFGFERRKP
jgi:hypothetical protein